jgi:hypothetical protein
MKQDWVMCCSFVITCVRVFSTVYPIPTYKVEWCAALFWLHVLEYFSTVLPIPPISRDWVMCCSLWLCVWSIFNSLPNSHLWSRDWVMCCSFCDSLCLSIFNSPTIPTYKAGIEWCAALWFLVLEYFSTVLQFPQSRDWVMCCSFVIPCVRVFFNSPTQFPPIKQGLSDVLLFCDYMC